MINPKPVFKVLIVCTGNSCRSPLAAALLRREVEHLPVAVDSAGLVAVNGAPASALAQQVALELGVDISNHQAKLLDQEMVKNADLILVMETAQWKSIIQLDPAAAPKIRLLGGYPEREVEIEDPIGKSIDFYRQTALLLEAGVIKVGRGIKAQFSKR